MLIKPKPSFPSQEIRRKGTYWEICYKNALKRPMSKPKALKYANSCIKPQHYWGGY